MYKLLLLIPYSFIMFYLLRGIYTNFKVTRNNYKKIQLTYDKRKWIMDLIFKFHKSELNNGTLTNKLYNTYNSICDDEDFYRDITFYNDVLIELYKDYIPEFKKEIRDSKLKNILQ